MINWINRYISYIPLLISLFALLGAYYFQYFEGLEPCTLCIWQRVPHYIVILSFSLTLFGRKIQAYTIMLIAALVNIVISLYHVGVETKMFSGLQSCGSDDLKNLTPEQLIQKLQSTPTAKCNFVSWEFLSISMAGWNAILSLMSFFVIIYVLYKALIKSKPY